MYKNINFVKSKLSLSLSLSRKLLLKFNHLNRPRANLAMIGCSEDKKGSYRKAQSAFTIVELLIVIVIIGILAAITIVSYTGITKRANDVTLQADLSNASKKIKMYYALYGVYPTMASDGNGGYCPTTPVDTNYCIKPSNGSTFSYALDADPNIAYSLTATRGSTTYKVTKDTSPTLASAITCPIGFIVVPGSSTYGTSDFCVMKYEAKNAGGNVPVSTATGSPWVSINQTDATTYSANVAGCTGCHLITEAEWMTLAKNVLSVASNWSGGSVGSGYIYSGHNDSAPNNALVADASDSNGYAGETNTGGNQRRTLTLTNGEVIWDLAGNVWEWTSGQTANGSANQPGVAGNAYASWIEWPNVTTPGSLAVNVTPGGTGLSGASSWTSTNGIGQLISNPADTVLRGFIRGGDWGTGSDAGVLALHLGNVPSATYTALGFRVSR